MFLPRLVFLLLFVAAAMAVAAEEPTSAPVPPQTVAPTVLDANRVGGDKDIMPDATTQSEISRAGVDTIAGSFKICLTVEGTINTVSLLN